MSSTVTVSPKYQVVIPQEVREHLKLKPGQKVMFVHWKGAYALVPVLSPDDAFGYLKGHDIDVQREKKDVD